MLILDIWKMCTFHLKVCGIQEMNPGRQIKSVMH